MNKETRVSEEMAAGIPEMPAEVLPVAAYRSDAVQARTAAAVRKSSREKYGVGAPPTGANSVVSRIR